jgi:hypothetical protein
MKTAVIEGRVDVRDLATCADYFIKQGMPAENKSDLMFKVLTTFAHASWQQGARKFETTEEALGFMFEIGLGPVNRMKLEGRRANNWTMSQAIMQERSSEFTELAQIASTNMIDSELAPEVRAQRATVEAEDKTQRMKDFIEQMKGGDKEWSV